MAKKQWRTLALFLAVFALGSLLLAACSRPGTASSSNSSGAASSSSSSSSSCPAGTTVKTNTSNFEQTCITLKKGDTLKLVQDQTSFHQFNYGEWNGTTQDPQPTPPGGPKVDGLQLSGASLDIGPFTTAGTYHIYCTVHPGMNLTVIVK